MRKNPALWTEAFYRAINPQVNHAGFHRAEPRWISPKRNRRMIDFDLWYIAAGSGGVKIDGRWVHFKAGDLICLKPGRHYQQERSDPDPPFDVYFAHVYPFGRAERTWTPILARRWPTKMSIRHCPRIGELFVHLFETATTQPEGYPVMLKAIMAQILDLVFTLLRCRLDSQLPPAWPKLLRAREFIDRRHAANLSLEQIAEAADLSASYLSGLFQRYFGSSPIDYRNACRLRAAKLLLARGESISRTAEKTGFESLHYFSRLFKHREGLTPSLFARRCRRRDAFGQPTPVSSR